MGIMISIADQVIIWSIPAAAVALLGLLLLGWFLPSDARKGWWFLNTLAIMASTFLVLHLV